MFINNVEAGTTERSHVLGVDVDMLRADELIRRVEALIHREPSSMVSYVNAECLNIAASDSHYHTILRNAALVYADGMGVVWASRCFGQPLPERVNLGDCLLQLAELCARAGYRLFLVGGAPGVAARAAEALQRASPTLSIVGTAHGFFTVEEESALIEQIRRAGPHILLVGMGVPKQEKWIWQHREQLGVPVLWGVGALFEYYANTVPRAPVWMRRTGLEWFFRLLVEPKRLWRRYLIGNLVFAARVGALLFVDAMLVTAVWLGAYGMRHHLNAVFGVPINAIGPYVKLIPLLVGVWLVVCAASGLYRRIMPMPIRQELQQVIGAACLGLLLMMATGFLLKELDLGRSVVLLAAGLLVLALAGSRMACRLLEWTRGQRPAARRRALIVGTGPLAQQVKQHIKQWPAGYEVVGFVAERLTTGWLGEGVVGSVSDLRDLIRCSRVDDVFIASPALSFHESLNLMTELGSTTQQFHIVSETLTPVVGQLSTQRIGDVPLITLPPIRPRPWYALTKRVCDGVLAAIGLVLLAPFLVLIALLIRLQVRGPSLFTQWRIGQDGKPFRMYKFRTMVVDTPAYEEAPNDLTDPRVTPLGRILRRLSLDELPQLVNVLRGDMSLVGPRPEMPFLVERYAPWQRQRHAVKPGLTGLWQVAGRKDLPLFEHIEYDVYYVRHRGWRLDLDILWRTIPVVLARRGAF